MMINRYTGRHYETGEPVTICTENGLITAIVPAGGEVMHYIAPGLVDNQVNGYGGKSFTKQGLSVEDIREVAGEMHRIGVTTFLPTLITSSREVLLENLAVIHEACQDPGLANTIPGIHLEGPYISPEEGYRGAHDPDWIRLPNLAEFSQLYAASGKRIIHLTLAPEIEGAMELIRLCISLGITVGLGHHNAGADRIHLAVEAGAGLAVHLGNGLANLIPRHDNPLWPQLSNDKLMISLIADGYHLTRDELRTFFQVKGRDGVILTSDMTDLAGMPPGEYVWDGKQVCLEPGGAIRYPASNVLAGAATPLIRDIGTMMQSVGCSMSEAINMASRNPAVFHGLRDRGELSAGRRADFIIYQVNNNEITLEKIVKSGIPCPDI